jgi:nickel/cobalt exporter
MQASTIFRLPIALLVMTALLLGHPMGNLSVNHYAKLVPSEKGIAMTFAMDLAEIPTFELLQAWDLPKEAPRGVLERRAAAEARLWVSRLRIVQNGKALLPTIESTELAVLDGAGNLPVFRVTTRLHVDAKAGRVEFEDENYPARTGWREVVIEAGISAKITAASKNSADLSYALTAYPQDPLLAPPQDKAAWLEWKAVVTPVNVSQALPGPSGASVAPMPSGAMASVSQAAGRPAEVVASGTVQRGDAISKLLRTENMSWGVMALLLGLSFWFGALHALEPGHGKTMVAAYLVGARGTPKHAVLLGATVTFAHTISVFALGLVTMFLSQYILPEKIVKVLGLVSGVSIIWLGGMMLWRRLQKLSGHHHQDRDHQHPHSHDHDHSHGPETHSHVPQGEISMGSLIALGASGGLVPCPSALILLLSAISIGKAGLGMMLLLTFSLGLALVLTATGLLVLYARNLFPERKGGSGMVFRFLPVISATAVLVIGILMTGYSLGLLPANRLIG